MVRALLAVPVLIFTATALRAQSTDPDRGPRLLNATAVERALRDAYPPSLRRTGISTFAIVRLFIDTAGKADTVRLVTSTGLYELNRAAREAAVTARWAAAVRAGSRIGVWTELPVRFVTDAVDGGEPTRPLVVLNRAELFATRHTFYPAEFHDLSVGARVGLAITVDSAGTVVDHSVITPSCFQLANDHAAAFARTIRFAPAADAHASATRTFTSVDFGRDSVWFTIRGDTIPRDSTQGPDGPTRAPRLRNRVDVERSLVANYPPQLRRTGIGGTVIVSLWIDADGRVGHRSVTTTSGHCDLDLAALAVATSMRFDPARRDNEKVGVWAEIPIIFTS